MVNGMGRAQRESTEDKCEVRRKKRWTGIDKCAGCRI